ncbi:co-chaperone YbbN [Persicimonas caeni]|uniref:Co-chaperone YbbN n=1 Tax=Persicimonas caeni TaxID=2292766 RepID=A0A4Y6PZ86_PERCE|nr:co-chaperone YbbN [Persicimonas caeni]QDG53628.1 co-chaperone YbbN [Persicimonas caeni]QED34849.1 co-chaperone YbbN [Persicimonas caeni]
MPETQHLIDVTDQNFEQEVIARSHDVPVVVDFWAPWCGPCRALGPTLESMAAKAGGEWILAKVNVDNNQQSAQRFGVRGIPAVKAFVDGRMVDEFTGALPQSRIEAWLDGILPSEPDAQLDEAEALEESGDLDAAASIYEQVLDEDPDHIDALLGMARVSAMRGENERAEELLDQVPIAERDGEYERVLLDVQAAQFAPVDELQARVEEDAADLESRWQLGIKLASQRRFDEALDHLLQIVIRDRGFRDDAGRETMVRIFEVMGPNTDEVREWQKKLGRAMY